MKAREVYGLGQLVTLPSEEAFAEMLARLTSKFDKEQAQTLRQLQFDNLDRYKKSLRDWLKKPENKDATADQIYTEGRKILVHYRKTPDQLRNELLPKIKPPTKEQIGDISRSIQDALTLAKTKKKSPYPEYPNAFQENGVWKVVIDCKTYRIEE